MTSKIEESDSYAMLCLSLSVFYFGWFMAPPCKSRKTDALSRMNLVHFGAPVLTAIQSSTIRAKHISSPQNATFEIRLVWFFYQFKQMMCVFLFQIALTTPFPTCLPLDPTPGFRRDNGTVPTGWFVLMLFRKIAAWKSSQHISIQNIIK